MDQKMEKKQRMKAYLNTTFGQEHIISPNRAVVIEQNYETKHRNWTQQQRMQACWPRLELDAQTIWIDKKIFFS